MSKPFKIFKYTIYTMLGIFALTVLYSGYIILQAKEDTPAIFTQALKAENTPLSLSSFGKERLDILLKIEDPAFYSHHGVDYKTPGQGLTTIPQAIVKFLYFDKFQAGFSKLKQSLIAAFAVTPLVPKKDQLTVFINQCYLGHQKGKAIKGFAQAAQVYFGKSFSTLTKDEYLSLVAMLIGPNGYHVIRKPKKNAQRVSRIKAVLDGRYTPKGLTDVYYDWK